MSWQQWLGLAHKTLPVALDKYVERDQQDITKLLVDLRNAAHAEGFVTPFADQPYDAPSAYSSIPLLKLAVVRAYARMSAVAAPELRVVLDAHLAEEASRLLADMDFQYKAYCTPEDKGIFSPEYPLNSIIYDNEISNSPQAALDYYLTTYPDIAAEPRDPVKGGGGPRRLS
jgi:hypothetical protein